MCDYVKINLSGIEETMLGNLEQSYNEKIKVINNEQESSLQLHIPNSLNDRLLINALNKFLDTFKDKNIYELIPSWIFDEDLSMVKGPTKDFFLTEKEAVFLKMLLKNEKITTYSEIMEELWKENKEVSQNAIRLFAKNIRKKLPPKILKNFQGIGYKLVL